MLSGRVEICIFDVWGTVCDDSWGAADTQVTCRQLGFQTTLANTLFNAVPGGTGLIWLDQVSCSGAETRLIDCPASPLGENNCLHTEDVVVSCLGTLQLRHALTVSHCYIAAECVSGVWQSFACILSDILCTHD